MRRTKTLGKRILGSVAAIALAGGILLTGTPSYKSSAASKTNGIWTPDFATVEEAHEYADGLNIRIMEEGVVLMKNENNALPLKRGTKITMLGRGSYDIKAGGTGASSGAPLKIDLQTALRGAGFKVNSLAEGFYESLGKGTLNNTTNNVQEDPALLKNMEDSLFSFGNKTVVWTVGRVGGESNDLAVANIASNKDKTKHMLEFNDNELAMIDYLSELKEAGTIDKVIMLVNIPNIFEMGPVQDSEAIDAILWIGQPGPNGLIGVANVINGSVSPSGRTVDLWDADHKKDPTWVNFSEGVQNTWNEETQTFDTASDYYNNQAYDDSGRAVGSTQVVEYEEGIYYGYKYYETADAEAKAGNYAGFKYEEQVVYPFGYGLSYTSFEQKLVTPAEEIEKAINAAKGLDDKISVEVEVKNTGDVAGKEVVQLYIHAPYTKGEIEKPEVSLVAFDKTETLKPGQSERLKLEVRIGDIASFDYNDANKNGYKGWEVEAGGYELRLQKNSHDVIDVAALTLTEKTRTLDTDNDETNNTPFSNGDDFDTLINVKDENSSGTMKLMSRSNFTGTFPTAPAHDDRKYGEHVNSLIVTTRQGVAGQQTADGKGKETRYLGATNGSDDLVTDPWYKTNADIPATWTQAASAEGRTDGKTKVQLYEMAGYDYFDTETIMPEGHPYAGLTAAKAWENFVNQLTYDEMKSLLANGYYQTPGLDSVGKELGGDQDGPASFPRGFGYTFATAVTVASTWNIDLAYERGRIIGNDSLFYNVPGWYAPSMNSHRSPFAGRNFEYYAQDALLSGYMAAAEVNGCQSKGAYVYIKHFALNEQEADRNGLATFASEQAIRENYLRSFEICTKESNPKGVMTSFNRVGAIHGSGNYALTQAVLRDEWGFHGQIVTDYYRATGMAQGNMAIRAGTELPLGRQWGTVISGTWDATLRDGKGGVRDGNETDGVIPESATQYYCVRSSATRILWVGANSNVNENQSYIDKSAFPTTQTVTLIAGVQSSAKLDFDAEKLGTTNVVFEPIRLVGTVMTTDVYEASDEVLPAGVSFDRTTGTFSGKMAAGTYTVPIRMKADFWITSTANVTINVVEPMTATAGSVTVDETVVNGTVFKANENITISEITTADEVGTSGITAITVQGVTGLPEGLTYDAEHGIITGTTAKTDYYYTVTVRVTTTTVTTDRRGNKQLTNANATGSMIVTVGEPELPAKSIVSAVIDDNGHLILSYSDDTTQDLGLVVGSNGVDGSNGFDGFTGEDGAGIKSIEKTSSDGLTDTYTVTLTNGSTYTFTVTNGAAGEKGEQGAQGLQGGNGSNVLGFVSLGVSVIVLAAAVVLFVRKKHSAV